MSVTVTLCTQPEHERGENEKHDSFFRGSEKESLPGLIEFGTPAFFQFSDLPSTPQWRGYFGAGRRCEFER
jgi:hypothetical protein